MKVILGLNELKNDGMGSAAVTLIKALRSQELTTIPVHAWHEIDLPEYEESYNPQFVVGNQEYGVDGATLRRMVDHINTLADDNDVFIHFGVPNWAACIPYFKPGLKIITAIHSINPSSLKLGKAYAERVSAFVCISEGVKTRFCKKLKTEFHPKVHLIADAVCATENFKHNYISGNKLKILYIGRIENTSKGCGKLPKILAELKKRNIPATLHLYGYFHNWKKQWNNAVQKYHVQEMVQYKGEIEHDKIYPLMLNYDCFIAPSNFEGFSLSIAEAMMMGMPCVISFIEGVTSWITDNGTAGILIKKTDIKGFADALEKLYRNPDYAEKIGATARKRIMSLASFESHATNYAKLVKKVSETNNYQMITPLSSLENYHHPEALKPWGPARILPIWLKTYLRRFMQ